MCHALDDVCPHESEEAKEHIRRKFMKFLSFTASLIGAIIIAKVIVYATFTYLGV